MESHRNERKKRDLGGDSKQGNNDDASFLSVLSLGS